MNLKRASVLAAIIALALMGLPQEDLPDFLRWRDDTIRPQDDATATAELIARDAKRLALTPERFTAIYRA